MYQAVPTQYRTLIIAAAISFLIGTAIIGTVLTVYRGHGGEQAETTTTEDIEVVKGQSK